MSDWNRVGADDLLNLEAEESAPTGRGALDGVSFDPAPAAPPPPPQPQQQPMSTLDTLRRQRDSIQSKLLRNHAQGARDGTYPDYMLDTDNNGQRYYGAKGKAAYEADVMSEKMLTRQVDELARREQENNQVAQAGRRAAQEMANKVWNELSPDVNKNVFDATLKGYRANLASNPDWGSPILRDPAQLRSLLEFYFDSAHSKAIREHRRTGSTGAGASGEIDYNDGDTNAGDRPGDKGPFVEFSGRTIYQKDDPVLYRVAAGIAESKAKSGSRVLGGRR